MTRCRVVLELASLIVAWSLTACSSRSGTANSPSVSGSSQGGTGSAPAAGAPVDSALQRQLVQVVAARVANP